MVGELQVVGMIRTPPEHNTKNPPGQVTYRPKQGLYLRDIIKRIEGEEGAQEAMKLPTPIAGPSKALADLKQALLDYCVIQREHFSPKERIILEDIRRIIKENT